ncbi:TetR/AcrR family transcriptional regulator [Streptomyces kasugaensis]|uniref:TetR/AcrR family transcriptional regulator n=1 Tax=Streptomyces kasugaensis TaxID=1946 RepID=A0A4Q9HPA7_STRKA|nr:TetR/AcrR family transcriptional regulator [Streptomyces kasugaensis]TBO56724.1 TetR/AcrR family transcriptional regulator [Streptomyces kasugaensis]
MGHRERLLAAARRCLEEQGYARTTSRDLAAAAGAPLGTINYHYGSKEGLLNAALLETLQEWGDRTVPGRSAAAPADGAGQRLELMWSRVIDAVQTQRPMLVAAVEAYAQAERAPEIRQQIADALERSRPQLAADLHGLDAEADEETARAVGSVHMALIAGLTQQWLADPERAPSSREMALGLRAIARGLESTT